jgi:hypothetical protein
MEAVMTTISEERRRIQLALFGERLAVPHWSDLPEPRQVEVVTLLAQLLVSVHSDSPCRAAQSQGVRDE